MKRSKDGGFHQKTSLVSTYMLIMVGIVFACLFLFSSLPVSAAEKRQDVAPTPTPSAEGETVPLPKFPPNRRSLLNIRTTVYHHWMLTSLDEQKVSCHIYMAVIGEPADGETGESPFLVNETLGDIVYWFIFLLFLTLNEKLDPDSVFSEFFKKRSILL